MYSLSLINTVEIVWELTIISILFILILFVSQKLLNKIQYLSGYYRICASCKNILMDNRWVSLEQFLENESDLELTHGICPTCEKKILDEIE